MTFSKSARYALYAALEMALADDEPVTVSSVAARHAIPATALAKVFQQVVRAGLATSARGIGGGYRLARPRSAISVLDVIAVFDPPRPPGQGLLTGRIEPASETPVDLGLRQLFDEVDELVRCTYASVSLETLVRRTHRRSAPTRPAIPNPREAGSSRRSPAPDEPQGSMRRAAEPATAHRAQRDQLR